MPMDLSNMIKETTFWRNNRKYVASYRTSNKH